MSYRKKCLAAIRFLYHRFYDEEGLLDLDPTAYIKRPGVAIERGYTPSEQDVARLLTASDSPASRPLPHWVYFSPSRRAKFWPDLDLHAGTWTLIGEGQKAYVFELHPLLVSELRRYRTGRASRTT